MWIVSRVKLAWSAVLIIIGTASGSSAGISKWMAFQRFEPKANGYTGWVADLSGAARPEYVKPGTSATTPKERHTGDELDFTEYFRIRQPFRMQVSISGPNWHSGDGACYPGAMETWLTVSEASKTPGTEYGGTWSSSEDEMILSQSGGHVTGTYSGEKGRVEGNVSSGRLEGYWGEASATHTCRVERLGTYKWGCIVWVQSADGKSFTGAGRIATRSARSRRSAPPTCGRCYLPYRSCTSRLRMRISSSRSLCRTARNRADGYRPI